MPRSYRAIADYYDAEYASNPILAREVPFFLQHLPKNRRLRVLELACGTARAAIPIAQAGHRVTGIDYARNMLHLARRKRDSVGLGDRELELVQADVLKLELGEKFDWICIFFNTLLSFTRLKELDQLMQNVRRHLRPRTGRFWFDIFQPNLVLLSKPHWEQLEPIVFYVPHLDRSVSRETEVHGDPANQVQHVTYHYRWHDQEGKQLHQTVKFDLTWLFPRELQLLLERNGLALQKLYGDYDGNPLDCNSERMIGICRVM
jgi:SAM-dependent methyltransferase